MKTNAFLVEFRVCNLSKELISDQTLNNRNMKTKYVLTALVAVVILLSGCKIGEHYAIQHGYLLRVKKINNF